MNHAAHVIGLIADTHGLLRPGTLAALGGVDAIIHAGDVGSSDILVELATVAPVHAVFGNTDDPFTPGLSEMVRLGLGRWTVVATHGHLVRHLTADALLARFDEDLIVYGHTHRSLVHRAGARVVCNPGAAGPRRFDLQPSVARVVLGPDAIDVQIVPLG